MAAYNLISTITVGSGGASNINFTSIPQTYTDLKLVLSIRDNQSQYFSNSLIRFNSDSGTNYSNVDLQGYNGTTTSARVTVSSSYTGYFNGASSTTDTFSNNEIYIPNYTSSLQKYFKSEAVQENNGTGATYVMSLRANLWTGTAAITSITISTAGTLNQYSSASLYGIKNS
jgi:hypothetical protein